MIAWIIIIGAIVAVVIFCKCNAPPKVPKPIPWAHQKCGCCDELVYIHDPNLSRWHDCHTFWCHKCVRNPKAECNCGNSNNQECVDDILKNPPNIRTHYDKGLQMWVKY